MGKIMAVVTCDKGKVGGGAPIFIADNPDGDRSSPSVLKKFWTLPHMI